jgi:hypothetical protein
MIQEKEENFSSLYVWEQRESERASAREFGINIVKGLVGQHGPVAALSEHRFGRLGVNRERTNLHIQIQFRSPQPDVKDRHTE